MADNTAFSLFAVATKRSKGGILGYSYRLATRRLYGASTEGPSATDELCSARVRSSSGQN